MQNCRKGPRNYIALGEVPKRPREYYTVITKFYLFRPYLFDYKSGNPLIFVLIIALYFLEDFHYRRGKHVRFFTNWNLPFLKYHWNYLIPLEKKKIVPSMLSRIGVSGFLSPFINIHDVQVLKVVHVRHASLRAHEFRFSCMSAIILG